MKSSLATWMAFSGIAAAAALFTNMATGQTQNEGIPSRAAIQANVVTPVQLEPTTDRIENLKLPEGFQIRKWGAVQNPRVIVAAGDDTVYVSQRSPGNIIMFKDTNRDGRADVQKIVATRKGIHGLALRGNQLYFVTIKEIYVADRKADGTLGTPRQLLNNLPDAGQHPNRTLGFGPDNMMYVTVGSTCNACDEPNAENATILRLTPQGRNKKVFATGLRNTIGFGWHPVSKKLYGMDHGIDFLGDDTQKEELNEIKPGKRYGWPHLYEDDKINAYPRPPQPYTYEDWAKMSEEPVLTYRAHSAPMEMEYYTGNQFPAEYKNDAFVAMRGSWNRQPPSGYEVVRVRFNKNGNPTSIEPFLTSFLLPDGEPGKSPGHIGRLVGLAQLPDGSMLLGDDTNNTIYRISYGAKNAGRMVASSLDEREITFNLPENEKVPTTITVRAGTFSNGGAIPFQHTAYDKNISPKLSWANVPRTAKSIVVMMEDPDSLSPKPFAHWLVANLPANTSSLPAKLPNTDKLPRDGALQGGTHSGKVGYFGPKPPADGIAHRYHFQVFALNTKLNLPVGYNRQAMLDAMKGHILAKGEIVGTYKRDPF